MKNAQLPRASGVYRDTKTIEDALLKARRLDEPAPQQHTNRHKTMDDFWIRMGWYKEKQGEVRLIRAKWEDDELTQTDAIRFLVEEVITKRQGKTGRKLRDAVLDITQEDFKMNRLGELLATWFRASPYDALDMAFPELNIKPWEMKTTPQGFYLTKENRVNAIRWLVEEIIAKRPENRDRELRNVLLDITEQDFYANRLTGLLCHHLGNSPYKAITEAYPELGIKPWEMAVTPQGFYKQRENRISAIRWLADEKLRKDPRDLTREDFDNNKLGGMLSNYYGHSPYNAVVDSYPGLNIKPWEMKVKPMGFYMERKNRIDAIRWLVEERLDKNPKDITKEDFQNNRLYGLLSYYHYSPHEALLEAGFVTEADGAYMKSRGNARFKP